MHEISDKFRSWQHKIVSHALKQWDQIPRKADQVQWNFFLLVFHRWYLVLFPKNLDIMSHSVIIPSCSNSKIKNSSRVTQNNFKQFVIWFTDRRLGDVEVVVIVICAMSITFKCLKLYHGNLISYSNFNLATFLIWFNRSSKHTEPERCNLVVSVSLPETVLNNETKIK